MKKLLNQSVLAFAFVGLVISNSASALDANGDACAPAVAIYKANGYKCTPFPWDTIYWNCSGKGFSWTMSEDEPGECVAYDDEYLESLQ